MAHLLFSFLLASAGPCPAQEPQAAGKTASEAVVEPARHEVVAANTLWDLAAHYYSDPWQWRRIYEANKESIKDPHWIYPGQVFVIPGLGRTVTVVKAAPAAPEASVQENARPVAEEKPVPEAEAEEAAPEEAETEEPAAPERQAYAPREAAGAEFLPDSLSAELPKGMAGQQPSLYRVRMPKTWAPDGKVVVFIDRESLAANGDEVEVSVKRGDEPARGQKYAVYRAAARTEQEEDQEGVYLQRVGVVEIDRKVSKRRYRAVIRDAGGTVERGDLIKREE